MMQRKIFKKRCVYGSFMLLWLFMVVALAAVSQAKTDDLSLIEARRQQADDTGQSAPAFVPGSWTLVIVPDIQNYSTIYPGLLELQMRWIVDNRKTSAIAYVVQNGDLTNYNRVFEWQRADKAFGLLDAAEVPYAIVPGNHDYSENGLTKDRTTLMNNYFPPKRFKKQRSFGGVMESNHIENSYHLFKANGQKWLIVGLEFGPRDVTLEWANKLLEKYSDRKAIIFTHAYLYDVNSVRYDWAKNGGRQDWNPHSYGMAGGVNDAEEMWQKLIKKNSNVVMVISGHVCHPDHGLGYQVSTGDHGNRVNEMAVDYQSLDIGGGAWLRLLEFQPDGKTVQVKSYSPLYDKYDVSPDNQFKFIMD